MKKDLLETIGAQLDAKEQERDKIIKEGKAQRKELKSKIAALKEKLNAPESLEDYKATAQELRDTEQYLNYITTASANASTCFLPDADYQAIGAQVLEEISEKQEQAAPEIQAKLFELIDLMEAYINDIEAHDALINRAARLNNPRYLNAVYSANKIYDTNPDKFGYWHAFCTMFFNQYREAMKIKRNDNGSTWGKR